METMRKTFSFPVLFSQRLERAVRPGNVILETHQLHLRSLKAQDRQGSCRGQYHGEPGARSSVSLSYTVMSMRRVVLSLQPRSCGNWSWAILMNFPNYWLCSVVASVLCENILPLKIFLEVPSPLVTSGAIAVCIFSWPLCYSQGLQCMLW